MRRGAGRAGSLAATASQALVPESRKVTRAVLAAALVLVAGGSAAVLAFRGGADAAPAQGYDVRFAAPPSESPVNVLHTWRVELRDAEGEPVTGASISVDGDMPAHGHGLPTRPLARELGGGRYALEGMKFQMGGEWFVELRIGGSRGRDVVRVDFALPAG